MWIKYYIYHHSDAHYSPNRHSADQSGDFCTMRRSQCQLQCDHYQWRQLLCMASGRHRLVRHKYYSQYISDSWFDYWYYHM